jgi:hypothetical protein
MAKRADITGGASQPDGRVGARAQLIAVEAALSGIGSLPAGGLTAVESAQAEGLRQAAGRLVEVAEQIQAEGLSVLGSMGQRRAHPLLGEERTLRREIAERLVKLEYRVGQRAQLERLNALRPRQSELPRLRLKPKPAGGKQRRVTNPADEPQ